MKTHRQHFFSTRAVAIGSFVGGPLAGGFMIGSNFWRLGEHRNAQVAWLLSAVATALLLWGAVSLPDGIMDKVPRFLIPAIYVPILAFLRDRLQGEKIRREQVDGAENVSGLKIAGVSVAGLVVTLALLVPFAMAMPPFGFSGDRLELGTGGVHQIYCKGEFDRGTAGQLEKYLVESGYFIEGTTGVAQLSKENGRWVVSLPAGRDFWEDPELLAWLAGAKKEIRALVHEDVGIVLVDEDALKTYAKEL